MVVDPHVHLRDFEQRDRETVKHGLEVARDSGVSAVFDMPNTNPPIMTINEVRDRLELVNEAGVSGVFYGLYMGLTSDKEQIKNAVAIYRAFPEVVGFKLYAGHSVGELGVIGIDNQRIVYETLANEGYDGVLAVHSEKEEEMHLGIWTPKAPISHCFARPEIAEVESVRDQINIVKETGFKGKLHIAHVSSPVSVGIIFNAKKEGLDISSGVCPHHLIYDWSQMFREDGILWKMNPPLRAPEDPKIMLKCLKDGLIDWIETDHAPHTEKGKLESPWMSGVTGLAHWPVFIEYLRANNFSEKRIEEVTHLNVLKKFNLDIPRNNFPLRDRRRDYINFYKGLEEKLGMADKL